MLVCLWSFLCVEVLCVFRGFVCFMRFCLFVFVVCGGFVFVFRGLVFVEV